VKEFNAKLGKLEFYFEWRLTLFSVLLCPFLISLGFWQLDRAEEKRLLSAQYKQRVAQSPLSLEQAVSGGLNNIATVRDRRIQFVGEATKDAYLLLDNQLHNGRFGYEVIAFIQAGAYRVPVNLGWVAGDPARRALPSINLPLGLREWRGRVYAPREGAYLLADEAPPPTLPAVIQTYEPQEYAAALPSVLSGPIATFVVRIDEAHPAAFVADWPVVNQSAEKHTGYAVQWFTMAAVLLVAFLGRSSNIASLIRGRQRQ
jgi:cytochrome oxidase assembly protein ShyY1